jgi:hypothetical protein
MTPTPYMTRRIASGNTIAGSQLQGTLQNDEGAESRSTADRE